MHNFIRKQSSIPDLLAITAFAALIVWTGIPLTRIFVARFIASIALVAIYTAIHFRKLGSLREPVTAALLYFAASVGCWWTLLWGGYLLDYRAPHFAPYFEDGMINEGIIYPIAYFIVYSPLVVAIAIAASTMTYRLAGRMLTSQTGK